MTFCRFLHFLFNHIFNTLTCMHTYTCIQVSVRQSMGSALRQNLLPTHRCILVRKKVLKHRHLINWPLLLASQKVETCIFMYICAAEIYFLFTVFWFILRPCNDGGGKGKCNWIQISEKSAVFALLCWDNIACTLCKINIWMYMGHFMCIGGWTLT